MTDKAYLQTNALGVGYGGKLLISDIQLTVRRGEIVTLIGPNGAGKSTILKTIARQLPPIAGTVLLEDTDAAALSGRAFAQRVSILITEAIDPERMTCRDVVESGRYPYTGQLGLLSDRDRQAAAQAMELTASTQLANQPFSQLSDGQRQRVMLARAICQEPELLILDEPTSFLDIHHKLQLLRILKRLVREKHIAVILSMHELELAQRFSDKVVCIRQGRIDRCGTPDEIFTQAYIEALYGIPAGSYSPYYGAAELEAATGAPRVFVISGGGTGCPVFRRLQRQGIPFATGILYDNDIDLPAAKALAAVTITTPALEPAGNDVLRLAMTQMDACRHVICTRDTFGSLDTANRQIFSYAKEKGYL